MTQAMIWVKPAGTCYKRFQVIILTSPARDSPLKPFVISGDTVLGKNFDAGARD